MNRKALVAEFIATFALIFIGVGSIVANEWSGGNIGLVGIALAHGLTIAVMASATGAVSGGHINPAVTVALFSAGKIDGKNAVGYVVAQVLGAISAAVLIRFALPENAIVFLPHGTPMLGEGVSVLNGMVTEAVLTFFLVFVVYGTAVDRRAPKVGGLFIGLTVGLDILMGGPITGAAMNPARHFGPALVDGNLTDAWLYWVAPIAGGILAAQVYKTQLE